MPQSPTSRLLAMAMALGLVASLGTWTAGASVATAACTHRVLIVAAMPLELNPLIREARVSAKQTINGRSFYLGTLAGLDVAMVMSGIGPVNATQTTQAAWGLSSCSLKAALFSGVAGSRGFIADVAVPRRWTNDNGKTWLDVNPAMLRVATTINARPLHLAQSVPVGDAACLCAGVDAPTPVTVPHVAVLRVGGDGTTSDPFGGRAVPCAPGAGDIAGCEPCLVAQDIPSNALAFAQHATPLVDPGFITALTATQTSTTSSADAQDEETGAVLKVTRAHHLPFLGIRGVSDGQGDPLHLPGFPFQFFVYRQLAANNAATFTVAFIKSWIHAGTPT